ncbi:MAG: tetratricopeptide repeat protein, partial [Cyanobacteria bacterium P01_D01_bin.128]
MAPLDIDPLNRREFHSLVVSIEASVNKLDLLIAICDDRNLQDALITTYEAELKEQGITPFRIRLNPKRPSLRAALQELFDREASLQSSEPAVITVLNANELLGVRLTEEKSEQEKFFFSLQWTREALRQFKAPVVIWLSDSIATRLSQRAKDFWSWRSGVFEFVAAEPEVVAQVLQSGGMMQMPQMQERETADAASQIPIADLQQQLASLEASAPESPLLITLYNSLGEAYEQEYNYHQALELYEKGLALAKAKNDLNGQARSLHNLGD